MKINILDSKVFNRISAGEVVEKPASIVKEMVENSIDAGASVIAVEIVGGGKKKIVVSDNGIGIEKEDIRNAFLPHATSKIKNVEDLDNIMTLGFRGEALASIASVCHVFLSSRAEGCDVGYCINVDGGTFGDIREIARNQGTTIEVNDLFYNTPVRAKFLRKDKSEEGEITHLMQKFMLAHPEISFSYIVDGKQIYNTISTELSDIIYTIYGREVYDNLIKIDYEEGDLKLQGYVVSPKLSKPNRTYQTLFVNHRYVENYLISTCIQGVYEPFLMKGKFPIYILDLIIRSDSVDVNVHPTKKEVKFENPNAIFGFIRRAIDNALAGSNHIANLGYFEEEYEGNPINNLFNHVEVAKIEPLSATEGSSYKSKLDNPELMTKNIVEKVDEYIEKAEESPLKKENELKTSFDDDCIVEKEVESTLPDFGKISLGERRSEVESRFFFDQSKERHSFSEFKKEQTNQKIFQESLKEEIKIIGTIFDTYVLFELKDNLYLVDQHAAHERQLYDKLVNRVDNEAVLKQNLLIPYEIKVNERERENILNILPSLRDLGFEITEVPYGFEIIAVPLVLEGLNIKAFVESILTESLAFDKKASDIIKERLAQNACKHAIKAGDVISNAQLADLVEQMKKGVLLCPHGRPIMLEITKKDIEKLFKRIV